MSLRMFLDAAYAYLVEQAQVSGMKLTDALERYAPFRAQTLGESVPRDPEAAVASQNDAALRRLAGSVKGMQGARG
jgi:hypothetical protein